jgi:hypothetical protein
MQDSAVAVLIGPGEGARVGPVVRHGGVAAHDAAALAARIWRSEPPGTLLVAGPALAALAELRGVSVHVAPSGNLCTAVWLAISEHLQRWAHEFGRLLVVDYDPALGHLHTAMLTLGERSRAR